MFYEVYIPSPETGGFDVTITVEADNWMTALKSGLERTGEGAASIRNVMCDIKDDNTIHVTDATTRRVFILRELGEEQQEAAPPAVEEVDDTAPTQKLQAPSFEEPKPVTSAPPATPKEPEAPRKDRAAQPATPKEPAPPKEPAAAPKAAASSQPEPKPAPKPASPAESTPARQTLDEPSWTSDDGWMNIGSSTYEALRRDEPKPKVVSETRAPSGQRQAVEIGRKEEKISQSILEEVFLEINQIHEGDMSMEEVINFTMDLAMEKVGAEAGSIMFADVNGRELYFATARGPKAHAVMDFRVPMGIGIAGFCAREGVSLAISDAERDPRFYKKISDALGYATKNLCCAPIEYEGRVYGAIELMNKGAQFETTEVNVLTYIGRQLAKFVHDLIMAREKLD